VSHISVDDTLESGPGGPFHLRPSGPAMLDR
jgi:hypothetical protein